MSQVRDIWKTGRKIPRFSVSHSRIQWRRKYSLDMAALVTHLDVYKRQLYKRSSIESSSEVVYESEPSSDEVVLDKLPLMDVIEMCIRDSSSCLQVFLLLWLTVQPAIMAIRLLQAWGQSLELLLWERLLSLDFWKGFSLWTYFRKNNTYLFSFFE